MLNKSFFVAVFIFLTFAFSYATVPQLINYQGYLTDAVGNPINGNRTIQFKIYNSATEGTTLWSETQNVSITEGFFSVLLGSVKPIQPPIFNNSETYLELKVGDDPAMSPRKRLVSVGYALHASNADSLNGFNANAFIRSVNGIPATNGNINLVGGNNISISSNPDQNKLMFSTTAANGLDLPYEGSVESSDPAFTISNIGTGSAGVFKIDNPDNNEYVLYISNNGKGKGIYSSAYSYGLYARSAANGGRSVYAIASGERGVGVFGSSSAADGYGVYGFCSKHYGVYGSSHTGFGGYFKSSDKNASGLFAKGGSEGYAAEFQGNVAIRERSSGDLIMELGAGLDYAEGFNISDSQEIEAGTVLSIDPNRPGKLKISNQPYDSKVAGIVAGANGLGSGVRLGAGQFDQDVALAGRVYCNVDATESAVEPGDLLTTSTTAGYAMKAADYARTHGAILGKAMESLEKGKKGQILVLVTLQ